MDDLPSMWFLRDDLSTFLKNRIEGADWIVEQDRDRAIRIRCVKYVEALRQLEAYERRALSDVPTIDELDRQIPPGYTGDEPTISPNSPHRKKD